MRLIKANIAGLASPRQQSEMKSILGGTWPPLKPLPVFRYETVAYRATIDFDRARGEWVCRKTSLPSNMLQELRGGLREITMALPHGEAETFTEGEEQQEQELEKDANRRLQALHDWRENYENGARYFELRSYLSESQRSEIHDSIRLSLTARQLQFNPKNVAYVFDALSTAGGRFAALMELAKRNKTRQETGPAAQREGAADAERAIDYDKQSLGTSSRELGPVLISNNRFVRDQDAAVRSTDADEFPAVSIKDILPEQEQAAFTERMAHTASQQFEIETSEMVDADSPLLVAHAQEEEHHSLAFTGFAAQVRTGQSSADGIPGIPGSPSRFLALEISAFPVAVFALLFLFAVIAFSVGLSVGRGPRGRRLPQTAKSMLAMDAKSPTPPAGQSTSRTPPPVPSSDTAGTNRLDNATPSEKESKDGTGGAKYFAEVRSPDSDSALTTESKPSANPAANSEHSGAIGLIVRNVSPPVSSKLTHSTRTVGSISSAPRSPARYRLSSTIGAAPHLTRPSTILVTAPGPGSQPFRVSFPKKAIAATSSFAMSSQLSVLVSAVADTPARLEAGELVSFVWPRYPGPGDRYGLAETTRVRATIGQLGQVLEVKFLSGSLSLFSATMRAIRHWRYRPTLLDKRPVQAQQDVTIEFRPPQASLQVSTRHPPHNELGAVK